MLFNREEMLQKAREQKAKFIAGMNDNMALMYISLFPMWKPEKEYAAGDRIRHNNWLYRVLADHTAEKDKDPNHAQDLYAPLKRSGV